MNEKVEELVAWIDRNPDKALIAIWVTGLALSFSGACVLAHARGKAVGKAAAREFLTYISKTTR